MKIDSLDKAVNYIESQDFKAVILCGLPGSGKSSLGLSLKKRGWVYISSDELRVKVLKLTKSRFATNDKYKHYKDLVYKKMRELGRDALELGKKVVFDATHINNQRRILLEFLKVEVGLEDEEMLIVWVDGGGKERIRLRIKQKSGKNKDGRSWEEAWETAYDFFQDKIDKGEVVVPMKNEKEVEILWLVN